MLGWDSSEKPNNKPKKKAQVITTIETPVIKHFKTDVRNGKVFITYVVIQASHHSNAKILNLQKLNKLSHKVRKTSQISPISNISNSGINSILKRMSR